MADTISGETNRDRKTMAREAGIGKLSLLAILAGVVTAFGTFAILLAAFSALAGIIGANTNFATIDWKTVGLGAGLATALALLIAYLFGGYVAGRMARRAGWLNGLAVFVLAIVVPAILAAILSSQANKVDPNATNSVLANLRSIGIPTSGAEWAKIGGIVGLASLLAMLLGSILGGILGERWHRKLPRPVRTETRTVADRPESNDQATAATRVDQAHEVHPERERLGRRVKLDERDSNQVDDTGSNRADHLRQ